MKKNLKEASYPDNPLCLSGQIDWLLDGQRSQRRPGAVMQRARVQPDLNVDR